MFPNPQYTDFQSDTEISAFAPQCEFAFLQNKGFNTCSWLIIQDQDGTASAWLLPILQTASMYQWDKENYILQCEKEYQLYIYSRANLFSAYRSGNQRQSGFGQPWLLVQTQPGMRHISAALKSAISNFLTEICFMQAITFVVVLIYTVAYSIIYQVLSCGANSKIQSLQTSGMQHLQWNVKCV